MIAYSLRRITQHYSDRVVLDIDQLDIESGGIHALLGANGAGKTTLLEILAFLAPPASGEIVFYGQRLSAGRMKGFREQVVLVDQHPIMFSRSVAGNIDYGLKIRKIGAKERQIRVDEALELVDLRHYKHARGHELSGGETQRLALARALALKPDVLLCDEPTASVDFTNSRSIEALLKRINEELHTTIVFTSHDRIQAATLTRQSLFLENGRLTDTEYENTFAVALVQKQEHGVVYRIDNTEVELSLPCLSASGEEPPGKGRLSVDPEKIHLHRHASEELIPVGTGKVLIVMAQGDTIYLSVDIGVPLVVHLSQTRYQRLKPLVGEWIHLSCEQDACTITANLPK